MWPLGNGVLIGYIWPKIAKTRFKYRGIHKKITIEERGLAQIAQTLAEKVVSWENITSPHIKLNKYILMKIMNKPVPRKRQAMNCIRNLTGKIMDEYEKSPDSGSRWEENIPLQIKKSGTLRPNIDVCPSLLTSNTTCYLVYLVLCSEITTPSATIITSWFVVRFQWKRPHERGKLEIGQRSL